MDIPHDTGASYDQRRVIDALFRHLRVARFRIRVSLQTDVELPAYKGAVLHGAFGRALADISPKLFTALYSPAETGGSSQAPSPLVLLPPADDGTCYLKGEELAFGVTLLGPAATRAFVALCAVERMGVLGLKGREGGRFEVIEITSMAPGGRHLPLSIEPAAQSAETAWLYTGADIAVPFLDTTATSVKLDFQTRLRLKQDDHLVRHTPSFRLLITRLLKRIRSLAGQEQWQADDQAAWSALLAQADTVNIRHDGLRWRDWSRYSGRQREWMKFGGLLGSVIYEGAVAPLLPLLALGEWVHVGGKTSFGLGSYQLTVPQDGSAGDKDNDAS